MASGLSKALARLREPRVAATLVAVLLLALALGWAWPTHQLRRDQETSYAVSVEVLRSMEATVERLQASAGTAQVPTGPANASLATVVDAAIRQAGLANSLERLEPVGDSGLRLEFGELAFDQFAGLLDGLAVEQGVAVQELSAQATGPGLARVSVVLSRGSR